MPAPYPLEFRQEAVRLLKRRDKSVPQLAAEFGVSPQSLRNWSRQLDVDEGRAEGLTGDEREALRRLRREVRTLSEEREILKKAAVFFAKDGGTGDGVRVHRREEDRALCQDAVPRPRGVAVGLSRVGQTAAIVPRA
jgi:transposase